MVIFRRNRRPGGPSPSQEHAAIDAFWRWWETTGAVDVSNAIDSHTLDPLTPLISRQVAAIHQELAWALAAGTASRHVLVVTPEGRHEVRAPARRWLRAAPAPDETWEYADQRRPLDDLDVTLHLAGHEVRMSEFVVAARREGTRLNVTLHHPSFSSLDPTVRTQTAFSALDAALGEGDVGVWIGSVETSELPPIDAFPLSGVRNAVADLKGDHLDEHGNPKWVMMHAERPDGVLMALAEAPLSPVLSPDLDTHVAVLVPFADLTPNGLPGPGSLDALRKLEDHINERLETSGRVVAHQTHGGVRTLHVYTDSTRPGVEQLRAAVSGWDQGAVVVNATADPGWSAVDHLRS
jgi:hypothetical protein